MRDQVRALVVGGGAVGVGIAYHLARAGWDVLLLERDELTAGSTWHAAGLLPLFNMGYAASHIHDRSLRLYRTLAAETGLDPGFRPVGNLRMAQTEVRMDEYRLYAATAETVGIPHEFLTPAEIRDRWPLVRTEDLVGALFHPTDGYINPADVTQALARGARAAGAEIVRRAQVDGLRWTGAEWVVTGRRMEERGGALRPGEETFEVRAEHVVTATGNHAQRTARLLGLRLPAIPVEHQYIVTEPDPVLAEWRRAHPEHPVLRDPDARWYAREERGGWILGPYEAGAPARFLHGVPEGFRADLFPLDLGRIEAEYHAFLHRLPSAEPLGLKADFNGPICYTPDGNPLLGPAPGLRNLWLAEGFSFGITAAGGAGHYLAQLITAGEAEIDLGALDPRRFGDWMTTEYAARKNEEAYAHVFVPHHPDEEREACRPLRTSPCHDRLAARGAQFGQVNGWERPNYFGPVGAPAGFDRGTRSFRRGAWWSFAAAEARAVREAAGLIDATALAKTRVAGPGARAFLAWFLCTRLPRPGRVALGHALTDAGTVLGEYVVAALSETEYYLVSGAAWAAHDADNLRRAAEERMSEFGPLELQDVTTQWGVFALAGPRARAVLAPLVRDAAPDTALSNARFPWGAVRRLELGMCPVRALRIAYTGELGWELHHPIEMQNYLFDLLMAAGAAEGLALVGARAQNWLRQEKSHRAFGAELGRDVTPVEAGLERFLDLGRDFRGRAALAGARPRLRCVTLFVDGPPDVDPWGREALWAGPARAGRLTSGGWSVAFGRSIGMGYVAPEHAAPGTRLAVRMQGGLWPAEVVADSPWDPQNARPRADG